MTQTVVLQGVDKEQNIYKEITPGGYGIAIKTKDILFSEQSKFQKVEIFDTDSKLGRVLTLDDLMMTVKEVTQKEGIKSYRTVINTGKEAGQEVFHLHIHILSGGIV